MIRPFFAVLMWVLIAVGHVFIYLGHLEVTIILWFLGVLIAVLLWRFRRR